MSSNRLAFAAFLLLSAALAFVPACNQEESNPETPLPSIAGPTALKALSVDSTRIGLTWTLSADEAKAELLAYQVTVKDTAGSLLNAFSVVKGLNQYVVSGLTEGTIYVFTIKATVSATATTTDSSTVRWSPAKRLETEAGAPILVFETADPNHPSGLDLYSPSAGGPVTRSLVGSDNALIDVFVYTVPSSNDLEIRSASLSSSIPGGKMTTFMPAYSSANDLNQDPRSLPPTTGDYNVLAVRIPDSIMTAGRIFFGKTQEGNIFRLLVYNQGSKLIAGSSPARFLQVKISYQSKVGVPYARPVDWIDNEDTIERVQ